MLEKSIIKTLCYSYVFNFPLKVEEVHARLVEQKATLEEVEAVLKKSKRIKSKSNYFYLGSPNDIKRRVQREQFSKEKIKVAKRKINLVRAIKSIEAIFITGAVATGNAKQQDDIDLCIVTKPGRLWTTRVLVNLIFDAFSIRRKPKSKMIDNKLCLNLWMTSMSLAVKKSDQNIYTAYEIIQMLPLFDRSNIKIKILSENKWVYKYLPNTPKVEEKAKINQETNIGHAEKFLYSLQKMYMNAKITREKININQAYFHPRETSKNVRDKFEKLVQMYA